MFCCTKKQQHFGQIINSICLQQECIRNKNQLSCAICLSQDHQGHNINTMKRMIPQLLSAHKEKTKYVLILDSLLSFVTENFGLQDKNGQNVVIQNLVARSIEIMSDLKDQVQSNNQQIMKMKQIFKNLNKTANQSNIPVSKSAIISSQSKIPSTLSTQKSQANSPSKKSLIVSNQNLKQGSSNSNMGSIDLFSQNLKHPYLSLSAQGRSVIKSSHPGHRYSILNSKSFSYQQNQVQVKIDNSPSGNIMIGLCHQHIIRQKDFVNNYGTNQGAYLIGQNGNHQQTAISFHHSINMINRKQVVGWNFTENDVLTVGFNYHQQYVYFRLQKSKGKSQQFTMALVAEDNSNKNYIRNLVKQDGLKLIVLLQNIGDQVSLLQV